ncbi:MAG: glutathione S-transferase [Alphaproteobacteria bacterium]|nr:MAG: glutathione S-transferase [Alphaproteobacteria bacterium]
MKLHWSPRSPYVRKVMIVANETGAVNGIDCVRTAVVRSKLNMELLGDSPVGRIPTMVLDDETVLSGSFTICMYLDSLHQGQKIIPENGKLKWPELELYGVADGLIDTLLALRGESLRSDSAGWPEVITVCNAKIIACLNWLEERCHNFTGRPYMIGQITTGVALDYLDFRFPDILWREGRPRLETWHSMFRERASSCATEITDE